MTAPLISAVVVSLALAVAPVSQTPPRASAQTAKPGSLALSVVSETGAPIAGAEITVRGAVDRSAKSGADGVATVLNLPAGTYRCRIIGDGFITLDKEVTIRAGVRATGEGVLSPAAPPPAPPPPPPVQRPVTQPVPAAGPVGTPRTASLADLAEQMLRDQQPIVERDLGCSVATASRLILIRESLASHTHADADEVIYVVAGDATLRIFDKDTNISAGWYGLVPRGLSHSLSRRGRNAPIVLSVQSGPACEGQR